jgi:hypothetical protein
LGTASQTLQDSGFKLGNVSVAPPTGDQAAASAADASGSEPSPASIIVLQSPAAGQKVASGTTVSFQVR